MTESTPPAVSVVIPTYNRRKRVRQAVASVLAQTFQDLEVIVIDDGSEDGTGEDLAGLDGRVRYRWQANRGVAAARNHGIRLARAPVVAFLDADNRWLPDHLEVLVALLDGHPDARLASTSPEFTVSGDERPQDARLIDPMPAELLSNRTGYVSGVAVRRDALIEVEGFDERLEVGEDDDLWLRLAMRGRFATVRRRTIVRRHTRSGLADRGRRSGVYTEANAVSLRRVKAELERMPGRPDREELLAHARGRLHVLAAVAALERGDLGAAREELARACALLPVLERNPGPILAQLWKSAHGRAALQRRVETAAAVMPNPSCHSTLFFRGYAAAKSLMRGRLWQAGRLVFRRPHLVRPDFLAKAYRPALVLVQRRLAASVHGRRVSEIS